MEKWIFLTLFVVFLSLVGCENPTYRLYEIDVLCRYPGKEDVKEKLIVDWIYQDEGATFLRFIDGRVRSYMGDCVFDRKTVKMKKSERFEYEAEFNSKNL